MTHKKIYWRGVECLIGEGFVLPRRRRAGGRKPYDDTEQLVGIALEGIKSDEYSSAHDAAKKLCEGKAKGRHESRQDSLRRAIRRAQKQQLTSTICKLE